MHGLQTGAPMRRISLVGIFTLVVLALATHVTTARADTPNTITQTAITSPSDPSYFYDPTDGAYGGFTVTGTTNSTDPSSDAVDIDCFVGDDGDSADSIYNLVSDVTLNSDGSFSTTVPYSSIEEIWDIPGMCRLRAVPVDTGPTSGLSSFTGPRVLLAYLSLDYEDTQLSDYSLVAPQLGATNSYESVGDCGLYSAELNDASVFGQEDGQSFNCADTSGLYWRNNPSSTDIQVDGAAAFAAYNSDESLTVSATQDPSNGDMTITETDPLDVGCWSSGCTASGVEEDRTIEQAADGHVVEITDSFRSIDGAAHSVDVDLASQQCFQASYCSYDFDPTQVLYEFPGESSFTAHTNGNTVSVGSQAPDSIYVQSTSGDVDGAITYFTPPSGPFTFSDDYAYSSSPVLYEASVLLAPYELDVPAGGSAQLSYAYSTETSQDALAPDIQTAQDLQTLPTVTFTSPAAGATTSSSTVTVSGQTAAVTGVSSVTINGVSATINGSSFSADVPLTSGANTLTAVVTTNSGVTASASESVIYTPPSTTTTTTTTTTTAITPASGSKWAGPVWLPIADTGTASHAGARKEKLSGRVIAGSGSVTYYFQYGPRGHLTHRSARVTLAASNSKRHVAFTIGGLSHGTKYTYRLVATGTYGRSAGRSRTFKTAAHTK